MGGEKWLVTTVIMELFFFYLMGTEQEVDMKERERETERRKDGDRRVF